MPISKSGSVSCSKTFFRAILYVTVSMGSNARWRPPIARANLSTTIAKCPRTGPVMASIFSDRACNWDLNSFKPVSQSIGSNCPEPRKLLRRIGPETRSGWYSACNPASQRALCLPMLVGYEGLPWTFFALPSITRTTIPSQEGQVRHSVAYQLSFPLTKSSGSAAGL